MWLKRKHSTTKGPNSTNNNKYKPIEKNYILKKKKYIENISNTSTNEYKEIGLTKPSNVGMEGYICVPHAHTKTIK